ncbi:MAG: hypothetical protein ABIU18_07220 [Novosphingobium sp.]
MKYAFAALAAVLTSVAVAGYSRTPTSVPVRTIAPSLCGRDEETLYSCPFARGTGSVCLGRAQLHYRFGHLRHLDIDIVNAPDWSNIHIGRVVGYRGAYENHIRFTNGQTHYVVYSAWLSNQSSPSGTPYSGISIFRGANGEKSIGHLDCPARMEAGSMSRGLDNPHPLVTKEVENGPFDGWL